MLFICISLTLKVFPWFSISRWFSSFFLPPAFFFEFFIDEIIKKTELGTLGAYSESEIYLIGQFICLSSLFPPLLSPFPPFPLSCSSITTQLPFPSPPSFLRSPLLYIHSLPLSSLLCSSPCSFLTTSPQVYSLFSFLSSRIHPLPLCSLFVLMLEANRWFARILNQTGA